MLYRRILYMGQFVAAVLCPSWVLISRGLLADGVGWAFLVYLVVCPFFTIGMLAVAGLTLARRSVRQERAVSWIDAGVFTGWYLAIIAYGLWASPLLAVVILLITLGAFWSGIYQFFTETRGRLRALVAGFEQAAAPATSAHESADAPRVIVVTSSEDRGGPAA